LGMASANSLMAILEGAGQVECTINGIGERAGNASIEEIVMGLRVRKDYYQADTQIRTEEIYKASRLVSKITSLVVQPNKAIVGANAFAHESGIHQHGLLQDKLTYEIMRPESVGVVKTRLVMGKHSGRHALRERLNTIGYDPTEVELTKAFERFKRLADQKKEIFDEDLDAIMTEEIGKFPEVYTLQYLHVESGSTVIPTATVEVEVEGHRIREVATGDGPVDAAYRTIAAITRTKSRLLSYEVKAITGGTDAQGEVTVRVEEDGHTALGYGADTDIILASAKAYLAALNKVAYWSKRWAQRPAPPSAASEPEVPRPSGETP
jgi:2-isopropylmalate synthase